MRYNFDVLIVPDEELANVWVAYCPRLALCTQGNSPPHAREMMEEAIGFVFEEDAADGFDSLSRERRGDAYWDQIRSEVEDVRLRGVSVDLNRAGSEGAGKRLLVMVSIDPAQEAHVEAAADLRLCG